MFDAGVWVSEGAVLRLEDGADVFVRCNNVEPREDVVVRQSSDALHCGKSLLEAGVEHCGVVSARFVERDERGGRGDPSGCEGEAGCGRDCGSGQQEGLYVRIACARELPERVLESPRMW